MQAHAGRTDHRYPYPDRVHKYERFPYDRMVCGQRVRRAQRKAAPVTGPHHVGDSFRNCKEARACGWTAI